MSTENTLYSTEQHLRFPAVISRARECSTWLAWLVSGMLLICFVVAASAANLIECPDCGKDVSRRAISCPHCGCPGNAIAQAVLALEESTKTNPVVRISSDAGDRFGVAIKHNDARYFVMDVAALGTAQSLTIENTKGAALPYSHLEVAQDAPLVRFSVDSNELEYLPISQDTKHASTLNADGTLLAAGQNGQVLPVAKLGSDGGVMALRSDKPGEPWNALKSGTRWTAVSPSTFRTQAELLARFREKRRNSSLTAEDRAAASNTKWISDHFRTEAQRLFDQNTQEQK